MAGLMDAGVVGVAAFEGWLCLVLIGGGGTSYWHESLMASDEIELAGETRVGGTS